MFIAGKIGAAVIKGSWKKQLINTITASNISHFRTSDNHCLRGLSLPLTIPECVRIDLVFM